MAGTGSPWWGSVFAVAPEDVGRWSVDLAATLAAAGVGRWWFVELEPGCLEAAVAGEAPPGWGATDGTSEPAPPMSLSPTLFPGGTVPPSYAELLVVGTAAVVEAHRSGTVLDPAAELAAFYDVLVDADERAAVRAAGAAWLTRVADAVAGETVAGVGEDGTGEPITSRPADERRGALLAVRPALDADVVALARAAEVEPSVVRSQLVARAAHAHLTRVWGSGPSRLQDEASLLRRLR